MSTVVRVMTLLEDVVYRHWDFRVGLMGDGAYLQCKFLVGHQGQVQFGRKWYVSSHATDSEIIQTALAAVLAAVEHEAREHFLYRGQAVFGPHIHIDARLDVREEVLP